MATDIAEINEMSRAIRRLSEKAGRLLRLMEVCGTHTVAIFRHGIRSLLPENITLLSGPGCPVCVTSIRDVDIAIALAKMPETVLATFGDMMRVPGGAGSLSAARAEGADVRVLYSPLEALRIARDNQDKKVVFFATGFETTSPLVAGTIVEAEGSGMENFFVHPAHKLVPPALRALLASGEALVDGFLLPGHVSAVIGSRPYGFLTREFGVPSVITGFSAGEILEGILMLLKQIAAGEPRVEIQYRSVVREEGNPRAWKVAAECFEPCDARWRGIGDIPASGLALKEKYAHRNAAAVFDLSGIPGHAEPRGCSCGEVLKGRKVPTDCPLFGKGCTPENPVGACMVSTEGSCAAYFRYGGYDSG